jgi:hypothetical protein
MAGKSFSANAFISPITEIMVCRSALLDIITFSARKAHGQAVGKNLQRLCAGRLRWRQMAEKLRYGVMENKLDLSSISTSV